MIIAYETGTTYSEPKFRGLASLDRRRNATAFNAFNAVFIQVYAIKIRSMQTTLYGL